MAKMWYIISARSNYEKKAVESIKENVEKHNASEFFGPMIVPVENISQLKRGKQVVVERKFFPGYILVNFDLTDATYSIIKDSKYVSGFLGGGEKPQPVSEKEIEEVRQKMEENKLVKKVETFERGENLKIIDGPFGSFNGIVSEVDQEKKRLKLTVTIFNRPTPVELDFNQVTRNIEGN